jgi:hypothetical protein
MLVWFEVTVSVATSLRPIHSSLPGKKYEKQLIYESRNLHRSGKKPNFAFYFVCAMRACTCVRAMTEHDIQQVTC